MVIEITKRYIIGSETLDSIIETFAKYHTDDCYCEFKEFLAEELEDCLEDEKIVSGDIESIKKICELRSQIEREKEKLLSRK